ncbi:MAG: hypothetical protein KC503_33680 [Myxococcales bacterium]|nr:hypothetical protein [Myxococcales bacterium]
MRNLALLVGAMLLVTAGVASADVIGPGGRARRYRNRRPKRPEPAPIHGRYTLHVTRSGKTKVDISRASLLAGARDVGAYRRPHKVGAVEAKQPSAARYAGLLLGVLLMSAAGIGWARRRGGRTGRLVPPALVALALLVGASLFSRYVEANRAPRRVWEQATRGTFQLTRSAYRGTVTIHVPRTQLQSSCRRMGYR